MPSNTQDTLATLRRWNLIQDNSGPHRTYYLAGAPEFKYASVTHILKETSDQTGLVQWQKRLGVEEANNQRQTAATRGNMAHSSAEYLLKTASALARRAVNKRTIKFDDRGLARIPPPITKWALEKVHKSLPPVGWSAAGYARGLTQWIVENVTQVHASEFTIHHPAGFAGTCDGLVDIKGKLYVADWKTTARDKHLDENHQYVHQLGAYSLGLQHLTGLRPQGGIVVLARRCGAPQTYELGLDELIHAENSYLERAKLYYEKLNQPV